MRSSEYEKMRDEGYRSGGGGPREDRIGREEVYI
jgi:hypothetical protein